MSSDVGHLLVTRVNSVAVASVNIAADSWPPQAGNLRERERARAPNRPPVHTAEVRPGVRAEETSGVVVVMYSASVPTGRRSQVVETVLSPHVYRHRRRDDALARPASTWVQRLSGPGPRSNERVVGTMRPAPGAAL